jgi:hypothetical protein
MMARSKTVEPDGSLQQAEGMRPGRAIDANLLKGMPDGE